MKNRLFPVLVILALLVVGLAFYRGWISLSSPGSDKGSNKVNVNLTMDGDKMQQDAAAVQDKTAELTGKAPRETNELVAPVNDSK